MKTEKVDASAALTVVPEGGAKKPGIAKIATFEYIGSTKLKAIYPKDDDFREATKSSGFYWKDGVWQRRAGNEFEGSVDDRAAELGNKLLRKGFTVEFPTENAKQKAISGDFAPECKRWVSICGGNFHMSWEYDPTSKIYNAARTIPGAHWKNGSMVVRIEFYREVLDFAETFDFGICQKAQEAVERYKAREQNFVTASVAVPETKEKLKKSGAILDTLDDLKDED